MLVLSRKPEEAIEIGPGIYVAVLRVVGNKVSLGINAPRDLAVRRVTLSEANRRVMNDRRHDDRT